jgi:cytochrome c peroxidase
MRKISLVLSILLGMTAFSAQADVASAQKLADKYTGIAKSIDPAFSPSAEEGKTFFNREIGMKGKKISCASCHTVNPADNGKHIVTGKSIRPLSPAVNPKRFSDLDKVEAKFVEHCNDITGSDCTAQEKANFITYLITVTEKTPKASSK